MTSIVDYLVEKGKISRVDADRVKVKRSKTMLPEDQLLLQNNLASEKDIALAKSDLFNIPYVDLETEIIDETLFAGADIKKLQMFMAVPFKTENGVVNVAIADPFDIQAIQALEHMFGTKINVYISTKGDIETILNRGD